MNFWERVVFSENDFFVTVLDRHTPIFFVSAHNNSQNQWTEQLEMEYMSVGEISICTKDLLMYW